MLLGIGFLWPQRTEGSSSGVPLGFVPVFKDSAPLGLLNMNQTHRKLLRDSLLTSPVDGA